MNKNHPTQTHTLTQKHSNIYESLSYWYRGEREERRRWRTRTEPYRHQIHSKNDKDEYGNIHKRADSENKKLRTSRCISDACIEQSPNRSQIMYSALFETTHFQSQRWKRLDRLKQVNTYKSKLFRHRNNERTDPKQSKQLDQGKPNNIIPNMNPMDSQSNHSKNNQKSQSNIITLNHTIAMKRFNSKKQTLSKTRRRSPIQAK